ncbi:GNAT family N-acetyltransferase [Cognatishimia maritima]|uniref:Acetyltransferase (GNAT) domain-containing protein n=1 Tax=Cognatishimia maritima TaxID=870908 RepID=A0A1M5SUY3_9RHOB|nr:GNAT family N-acetyltransferase [Cognatishimia maritima]SHH42068.1 Acetyltransferase (GNAT) domain-containing protein [Cognatishimia maritima]
MITDFETSRLRVRNWKDVLSNGMAPRWLEKGLAQLLTPKVLEHLPPSLQLSGGKSEIADWVALQAGEGETYLVQDRHSGALLGLLILAAFGESPAPIQLHIGYLLAEEAWGKGIATELVAGLVKGLPEGRNITVMGGVGHDNPGSAKVLERSGFTISDDHSSEDTQMFVLHKP